MKKVTRELVIIFFIALTTFFLAAPPVSQAGEDCTEEGYCDQVCFGDPYIFCIYMDCGNGTQACQKTNHNL